MNVTILRLGHRFARDKRTSTHLALVARALGARELVLDSRDEDIRKSVEKISRQWGGNFEISFARDWKGYLKEFRGDKVHLTMYGININEKIDVIKSSKADKLVIVGSQKVPSEVYEMADHNIAIGNQPHSEIAAMAVFLDRLFGGGELEIDMAGKKRIIPQERGKKFA